MVLDWDDLWSTQREQISLFASVIRSLLVYRRGMVFRVSWLIGQANTRLNFSSSKLYLKNIMPSSSLTNLIHWISSHRTRWPLLSFLVFWTQVDATCWKSKMSLCLRGMTRSGHSQHNVPAARCVDRSVLFSSSNCIESHSIWVCPVTRYFCLNVWDSVDSMHERCRQILVPVLPSSE